MSAESDNARGFSTSDGTRQPHSLEAERAVLGAILSAPESISTAIETLRPEMFYAEQHKSLYELLLTMFTEAQSGKLDIIEVLESSVRRGIFETATEGKRYLTALVEEVPSAKNLESYCEIVRDRYMARSLANIAKDIIREVENDSKPTQLLLDTAEQRLYDLRQGRDARGLVPLRDIMVQTYQHLGDLSSPEGDKLRGVRTNFPELDSLLSGGFKNSELVVLAARPGIGKTSLALNISTNVARYSGKAVAIYSLEMSLEQLAARMLSSEARIDSGKLQTGILEPKEWVKLAECADALAGTNILLSEASGISVAQMKAQLRTVRNLGLVVIDYLQLMSSPERTENRVLEISAITRNLKLMAKELNIPILLLSQLNRGLENRSRDDRRPHAADLRESGSIEQDADIILFLYNDFKYNPQKADPNMVECIVEKNRQGSTGTIQLVWTPAYTRFSSPERREIEPPR